MSGALQFPHDAELPALSPTQLPRAGNRMKSARPKSPKICRAEKKQKNNNSEGPK